MGFWGFQSVKNSDDNFFQRLWVPFTVKIGDTVWLDYKHTPMDIPYKLFQVCLG
jgi:hypothetical protein